MSKSSAFANDVLLLIFNAVPIANLADNAASAPLAALSVALHSADPGGAGTQSTSEIAYTGYARASVARNGGGWVVSGNSVSPAAAIDFPACTGGAAVATHFSVGVGAGASKILRRGIIGSRLGPFSAATSDAITIPGLAGLAVDDRVIFAAVDGSSLPAGVTAGVAYWVKTVSGNDITISATQGGATLDITAAGDGLAYRSTPLSVAEGVTPRLSASSAIVEE